MALSASTPSSKPYLWGMGGEVAPSKVRLPYPLAHDLGEEMLGRVLGDSTTAGMENPKHK